jgi:hypothetical protein
MLLVGCLTTLSVSAQQVPDHLAQPTLEQILGRKSCDTRTTPNGFEVHGQDPQTLFYSGRIYASTLCPDADRNGATIYRACADASWDPTGAVVTFKILWKETVRFSHSALEQKDARHRCLTQQVTD